MEAQGLSGTRLKTDRLGSVGVNNGGGEEPGCLGAVGIPNGIGLGG